MGAGPCRAPVALTQALGTDAEAGCILAGFTHGCRTSPGSSSSDVEGRWWGWQQCRPGTNLSCQTHDQLHPVVRSVLLPVAHLGQLLPWLAWS